MEIERWESVTFQEFSWWIISDISWIFKWLYGRVYERWEDFGCFSY